MLQTSISFDTRHANVEDGDRIAFQIGWDHARHGLVPPAATLAPGQPLGQGWHAAQSVLGRRTLPARRAVRQWLALRLAAWQAGESFDLDQLTPAHLQQLETPRCPVRRTLLGGAEGSADAAVIVRLNESAAWAAGHLVTLSRAAAMAIRGVEVHGALHRAAEAATNSGHVDGLDSKEWLRVAALRAMATPLPFADAARLPLAALPPNRVRVLNAAQGLQALVTQAFAATGWAARAAEIARLLPEHSWRHDFNLFVGAMAPRVLEASAAGADPAGLRQALEDAWLHPRVQRRWQHLVFSLGEAGVVALLDRVAELPQPGRRVLQHALPQAVEAWRLPAITRLTRRSPPGRAGHGRPSALTPALARVSALAAAATA
jgi:hypothetical protein